MKHFLVVDDEETMRVARDLAALTGTSVQTALGRAVRQELVRAREERRHASDSALWRAMDCRPDGPFSLLGRRN